VTDLAKEPAPSWKACSFGKTRTKFALLTFVLTAGLALAADVTTPPGRVTVCAGNAVKAVINGKKLNEISECTISSGFIGIQSERGDIEIRNLTIEPLR
jgi:hypothetical protein